jgi:hypothetical protein
MDRFEFTKTEKQSTDVLFFVILINTCRRFSQNNNKNMMIKITVPNKSAKHVKKRK